MKTELINYIFGEIAPIAYVAAFFFVFFGLIIKWYIQVIRGVKLSPHTPDKFSWAYFWKNNLFKKMFGFFASAVICFISLRFSSELLNTPFSMFLAFLVGLGFDFIIDIISKWQGRLKN